MRNRVAFALFLSLLLVGTATWMRNKNLPKAELTLVNREGIVSFDSNFDTTAFLNASDKTLEGDSLSSTDLISRQLITDYIGLASNGQATEANLNALVNKYVDQIPAINSATRINQLDLQIVKDTQENFQNYNSITTEIELERRKSVDAVYRSGGDFSKLNPEFYSFSQTISAAYESAATKLKGVPVPASLVFSHIKLVNNYFSSAAGMKAMSKTEEDPMAAFAGMVMVNNNLKEEETVINEIVAILIKNGV